MSTENPRFTITVTDEMLNDIDDFRYEHRYPTRTKAVNELFRIGLDAIKNQKHSNDKTETMLLQNGKFVQNEKGLIPVIEAFEIISIGGKRYAVIDKDVKNSEVASIEAHTLQPEPMQAVHNAPNMVFGS